MRAVNPSFLIGGILFATAFVIGGLASYRNVRDSRGPRERRYVLRMCVLTWVVILSMLVSAYVLHPPWLYYVVGAYFVVTPVLFYRWAHTHQLIREMERRAGEPRSQTQSAPG
jgi:hypothetical protein